MKGSAVVSYGVYLPRHRVRGDGDGSASSGPGCRRRVLAAFDEDTTTMGVEALRQLGTAARPRSIWFATTAPAYVDKTNAAAIHAAVRGAPDTFAVDVGGSFRSPVAALRGAAASGGVAVLADLRTGWPGSGDEFESGDGATAIAFGPPGEAVATVTGEASTTAEFLDRWRHPGAIVGSSWEERFGFDQYRPLIERATSAALHDAGISSPDHVVVSSPHGRVVSGARRSWGGSDVVDLDVGFAGTADPGIRLAAALDRARPGETILLVVAADGCDALVLEVGAAIERSRVGPMVAAQMAGGRDVPYSTYLAWRGLLRREPPRRPEPDRAAAPPASRAVGWKFALVASRCTGCGLVHAPPAVVCKGCRAVERMEPFPLSNATGTVATFTVDRLAFSPSPPVIDVIVDFDGGGRCGLEMTDASPEEVAVGTRVEVTFRRLYTSGGIHNYFWKARPLTRGAPTGRAG